MHQPINESEHQKFRSLTFTQEQRLEQLLQAEHAKEMKEIAMRSLEKTLAMTGHAVDTAGIIRAKYKKIFDDAVASYYAAKNAAYD